MPAVPPCGPQQGCCPAGQFSQGNPDLAHGTCLCLGTGFPPCPSGACRFDPAEVCCGTGVCLVSATMACCTDTCADLTSDPNHCGACANPCASGETCCQGACVNTLTDKTHCGGGFNFCLFGNCVGGVCG